MSKKGKQMTYLFGPYHPLEWKLRRHWLPSFTIMITHHKVYVRAKIDIFSCGMRGFGPQLPPESSVSLFLDIELCASPLTSKLESSYRKHTRQDISLLWMSEYSSLLSNRIISSKPLASRIRIRLTASCEHRQKALMMENLSATWNECIMSCQTL